MAQPTTHRHRRASTVFSIYSTYFSQSNEYFLRCPKSHAYLNDAKIDLQTARIADSDSCASSCQAIGPGSVSVSAVSRMALSLGSTGITQVLHLLVDFAVCVRFPPLGEVGATLNREVGSTEARQDGRLVRT